jgi:tyrosyl-tRNA synthetase
MAVHDDFIINYFTLATNIPLREIEEIQQQLTKGEHPMNIKKKLAHQVVTELYSENEAQKAAEHFKKTVQEKEIETGNIETISLASDSQSLADFLVDKKLVESKSEAKRLIDQKAVEIDGVIIETNTFLAEIPQFKHNVLLRVGKRALVRLN